MKPDFLNNIFIWILFVPTPRHDVDIMVHFAPPCISSIFDGFKLFLVLHFIVDLHSF